MHKHIKTLVAIVAVAAMLVGVPAQAVTYASGGYLTGGTAGTQVSSTNEGRTVQILESTIIHATHTDGFVDKGDAIVVLGTTNDGAIVGVSQNSAAAATDYVAVDTEGIWNLTVTGSDDDGNNAVVIGDDLFINTSTAAVTKIRDANVSRYFGTALGAVTAGSSTVIAVKVHKSPAQMGTVQVGSSAAPYVRDLANHRFYDLNFDNGATSGDNRGMYLRLHLTGAGGGGEAFRAFTVVYDVAAGTAHGAHQSLAFNDTGSVTGLGVATRSTLHIPDDATWAPGTIAAIQPEIWNDGAASDTDGATEVSFIRLVNGGNASGIADVDDDANFVTLSGGATGAGNMFAAKTASAVSHGLRCKIHGVTYYIMVSDAQ